MAKYEINGWSGTGWERSDDATSEREAMKIASAMRGSYDPHDSSAKVEVDRNGFPIAKWSGSERGKWLRVN